MAEERNGTRLNLLAGTAIVGLVITIAEIVVLVWVAGQIGWWTLLAIFGTALIGMAVLGLAGKKSLNGIRTAIRSEDLDALSPADTGLVFVGGSLLLVPGFITDVIGLLMVIPFTRPLFHKFGGWYLRQLAKPFVGAARARPSNVIPGEVVDDAPADEEKNDGPLVIEGTVIDDEERGR